VSDSINELPEGWIETSLGQLTEPSKEKVDPTSLKEESNYIGLEHIKSNAGSILGYGISSDVCSSKSIFKKGDLLYGKLRPYLNKVYLAEIDGIYSTDIMVFPKSETILNQYAKYRFLSNDFVQYANANSTGVQHPRVKFESLAEFPILLPPLNEQQRIVSTIEQLTDRSHKARAALEDVPKLIAQFRQSVLAAAFRGDLTADWREKNLGKEKIVQSVEVKEYYYHKVTAAGAWEKCLFQDICTVIGGSQPSKNHFVYEPEEGYIRLIQIRDYKSDKFTTFIPKELARRFCNKSDIMIGRYGPPIFQILRGLEGAYNVALMKAEPNLEKVDKEFLFYYLQIPHLFNYVEAASQRTAGQDGVKKELLNTYTVFVPSLDEQLLIVKKVKEAFKAIDIIENQHLQLFQEIPGLDRSILAKAFRGELVPQDPNDEPATVLLERIRAEREQTSTPKQRGKTTRKNSSKQLSIDGIE
jgi:type I restriction enzyme, S subunit